MSVRVLRVNEMPCNVKVWVEDCDDGRFVVYVDSELIGERGADALQSALNAVIGGWQRLDTSLVYATLRAVTG